MSQSLLPLIKPGGRLVQLSSMASSLSNYSASIREQFLNVRTIPELTAMMESYKSAVEADTHNADGWPSSGYMVSKAGITAMARVQAAEEKASGGDRLINSCCPGWVVTDMTKGKGAKSPDEGAQTPVKLALGDIGGTAGEFWQNEKVSPW